MNILVQYLKRPRNLAVTVALIFVGIFFIGFVFPKNEEYVNKTDSNIDIDTKTLVDKVSELIYLPQNEVPTIATVTDLVPLRGQSFFAEAKKGDKVLIYTKAKKAVLYNPASNKIVTIAPLSMDTETQQLEY